MSALVWLAVIFSAGPALLFLRNLQIFTPPRVLDVAADDVSILIPARDEERNIGAAVEAALANAGAEVLVLDDASTDRTAKLVREMAAREPRLRLLAGEPLPEGWIGKNWACAQLAQASARTFLLFADADVRLAPQAAVSLSRWLQREGAQLASGLPRQTVATFSEKLLIPLIHFVLLGFLPIGRMRASRNLAYATGVGQLVLAQAAAYRASGGHAAIRERIHDGLALPKQFRAAGFRTDLFDPSELATCRMYHSDGEVWRGLTKNTHEGLGAPTRIVPVTGILSLGQVAPFALLACAHWLSGWQMAGALLAAMLAIVPRVLAVRRFAQPIMPILLHPVGVIALLGIQWFGLIRFWLGRSGRWKGRRYRPQSAGLGSAR